MITYFIYLIFGGLIFLAEYFTRQGRDFQSLWILFCGMLIIISTWFPVQKGVVDIYGTERTKRNPLYSLGHLRKPSKRKRGYHIFSEIKGLFITEIYVIIHLIIILIYWFYSTFISHRFLKSMYMLLWVVIAVLPRLVVETYYEIILKKAFREKYRGRNNWGPDRYLDIYGTRAEHFQMKYCSYAIFIKALSDVCLKRRYLLQGKYKVGQSGEINIYIKEEKAVFQFLGIIYFPELTKDDNENIELFFEKFIKENVGLSRIGVPVRVMFLICVEKENYIFRNLIHRSICQKGIRFRGLNAGVAFDTQRFYIPKQNKLWGRMGYQKLRKEIWEILS